MKPLPNWMLWLAGVLTVAGVLLVAQQQELNERRGNLPAWSIVKQRTNEHYQLDNYGYVTDWGSIIAGFTNLADVKAELDLRRRILNHKTKPEPEKPKPFWEIVK